MPEIDEVSKIRKEISRVYFFTMMSISFSPVYFFPRVSYVDASGTDIFFFLTISSQEEEVVVRQGWKRRRFHEGNITHTHTPRIQKKGSFKWRRSFPGTQGRLRLIFIFLLLLFVLLPFPLYSSSSRSKSCRLERTRKWKFLVVWLDSCFFFFFYFDGEKDDLK